MGITEKELILQAVIDAITFPDGSVDADIIETLYDAGCLESVIAHIGAGVQA